MAAKTDTQYQAESDANTLTRAEEIRQNKQRHQAAQGHLKKLGDQVAAARGAEMDRKTIEKRVGKKLKSTFGGAKPLQAVAAKTKKGGFHRALGIPESKKIPVGLRDAIASAKVGSTVRGHKVTSKLHKEAVLARTYAKAG